MTRYLFVSESPVVLAEPTLPDLTAFFAPDAPFTFWDSRTGGTDGSADLFNVAGTALLDVASLVTDGSGVLPPFRGQDDQVVGWVDFGGGLPRTPIVSVEATQSILTDYISGLLSGATSGIVGAPTTWPPTFPSDLHSHVATEISDSTPTGRAVLKAADAATARTAIGALASSFTGLQIGTTGTTAAAGNRVYTATQTTFAPAGGLTATDVQGAIVQASQSGGGGTAAIDVWRYASGAYPTLPVAQPIGLEYKIALGPVQPMVLPSWAGVDPGDVVFAYESAPLT